MFCPNCAAQNNDAQHYCRTCGLKLDAILREVAEQFPSEEYAVLARRKRAFEVVGMFSLSVSALIGVMLLLGKVFYYKLILFGPDVLFYSAFGALILFGLLSVFFFNYPTLFMKFDKVNPRQLTVPETNDEKLDTNKLLTDPNFEPASVIEHTTELLTRKK